MKLEANTISKFEIILKKGTRHPHEKYFLNIEEKI